MQSSMVKRWSAPAIAAIIVTVTGFAAQLPSPAGGSLQEISTKFHLAAPKPIHVPDVPMKSVREVHPSLARISGWISSVGASAALGNADGDGLPNDLCLVDPRTDLVTLHPNIGTLSPDEKPRSDPIVLDPSPLPYDPLCQSDECKIKPRVAPMGCMFTDLNQDGFADVVVYFWGRTPIAFLQISSQNGGAPLTRNSFKAIELVDKPERWFTNAATSADFDGDGGVDFVFANYFADDSDILNAQGSGSSSMHSTMSKSFTGGRKHFLLWKNARTGADPDASFAHETPLADDAIGRGWTLAVGAADLDGDLLPEIYLANDFGPDRLLHNRSTPSHLGFVLAEGERGFFTPKSAVLGHDSFKGMGIDFADVKGHGFLDLFVSNIAAPYSLNESHMMWVNTGDTGALQRGIAPFVQRSEEMGLSRSSWGWDAKFADLNNSGSLVLIQATGFLKGKTNRWPELQALATSNDQIMSHPEFWPSFRPGDDLSGQSQKRSNAIFARDTEGRFYDIAEKLGLTEPWITRGVAIADVDGDGAIDIVFANQWEDSVYIHNECKDCGAFLGLHLLRQRDAGAPLASVRPGHPVGLRLPPAIGAVVTATTADGHKLVAQVDGGNGHSGRRSPDVHFGLGSTANVAPIEVQIKWRAFNGEPRSTTIQVKPGWNTVVLGS